MWRDYLVFDGRHDIAVGFAESVAETSDFGAIAPNHFLSQFYSLGRFTLSISNCRHHKPVTNCTE